MGTVSIANTSANLSADTLLSAENADTITGLKTFDRDPSAPFAVTASSTVVANLDADKLDGLEGSAYTRNDGGANTGGQVKFPATQVPSSDVNTLDDYEEGTWTPVLTAATPGNLSVAYTTQVGRYIKIGKLVRATCFIQTSTWTHTTASGDIQITGLPFAHVTSSGGDSYGAVIFNGFTKANYTQMTAAITSALSLINMIVCGTGQTNAIAAVTDFPTAGTVVLRVTISYEAAA